MARRYGPCAGISRRAVAIAAIPEVSLRFIGQTCPMGTIVERGRLGREFRTLSCMVEIYCADKHPRAGGQPLCPDCGAFLAYAERRLEKCPYGPAKPTCAKCPIHCYKPQPRALAREIMRYAGPRMLVRHPWLSVTHVLDKLRRVEHPMASRRRGEPPAPRI